MSLGLAIFLSTLVVSAVLLYHWGHLRSKQSGFGWKKGLKAIGVTAIAFLVVGGAWLSYSYYESQPTTQTEYYDLALGMTMAEVIYVKGQPTNVYEDDPKDKRWQSVIAVTDLQNQEKNDVKDYVDWSFDLGENQQRLDVSFSPKTKTLSKIACYADAALTYGACYLLGITSGMSEEEVIRRLGKPEHAKIGDATKIMDYPRLNASIYFSKKKVYMLLVKAPAEAVPR